jgi:integrase
MLTDAQVRKAKSPAKNTKLYDERGLYLLLTPAGGKLWRFKYRFDGKEKLLTIGTYGELSLREARDERDLARRLIAHGTDPATAKQAEKRQGAISAADTFEVVAREWLEAVKPRWAEVTYNDTQKRLEAFAFPKLGTRPIARIEIPELLGVLRKVEERGTVLTAHKLANHCKQVFRFGIASGRCKANPAADLKGALKSLPKAKPMAALSVTDLPDFLRAIDTYQGERSTQLALKLLALTMVRTNELRLARWSELDLDRREWSIPAERMKNGQPHHVPLSEQAVACFRELHKVNGHRELVLAGRLPTKPVSKNTILFAIYRMGYHSRMTGHGFRAVASTALNEMGYRPDVIERQLAHTEKNAVRAAYHRSQYLEERTRMMQAWADHLDVLFSGAIGKVLTFKAANAA